MSSKRSRQAEEEEAPVGGGSDSDSDSEESSSSDEEEEEDMKLDGRLEEEGLEDIDFDFDDPQERHFHAIRGLLRQNPMAALANDVDLSALSDLLASDEKSVGTVVGSGGGDDLVGFAAAVQLAKYAPKANPGVDALAKALKAAGRSGDRGAFVSHAFFVNTPPKVVAAAFECFAKDLKDLTFDRVFLLVKAEAAAAAAPAKKKPKAAATPVEYPAFYDDEFAKLATSNADLGKGARLLELAPKKFRTAVANIRQLADK